ncbi:MAG: hypothetical protein JWO05_3202 [Gemmatimonadetes bacterium]|nr:hypothetical protein [Gemmatimonadota bacterium]
MNRRTQLTLALAAVGIAVWGFGARVDDQRFRWAGIIVLALAALSRFVARRGDSVE